MKRAEPKLEWMPPSAFKAYAKNPKRHPPAQLASLVASIKGFGWTRPLLVDEKLQIIAGHGAWIASQQAKLDRVSCIRLEGLTPAQKRAYVIADNKLSELGAWDKALLGLELGDLKKLGIDLTITGFKLNEVNALLSRTPTTGKTDPDALPKIGKKAVSVLGDIWQCGPHRVMCALASDEKAIAKLLDGKKADASLSDPPYGIGLEYASHKDTREALIDTIKGFVPLALKYSTVTLITCGTKNPWLYPEPEWVLCWFYGGGQFRSPWGFNCWQPVLAYGKCPYLAGGLGSRPDSIDMNTPANSAELDHPCPKPVKLWNWLLERCTTGAGQSVLDFFLGSGTTLISAQQLQRIAYGVEMEPLYIDLAVRRWQDFTGEKAKHTGSGKTFDEIAASKKRR